MAIKAVLFDLDGTLWTLGPDIDDWDPVTAIQARALRPHFDRLSFRFDPADFVRDLIANVTATLRPPSADFSEPSWYPCLERVLAKYGHTCERVDASLILDEINGVPFRELGIVAFPDAAPTLTAVRELGMKIGAVTNNPKPAHILANQAIDLGLPDVFDVIVSSWELGWRKPHRRPFEAALTALNVRPEQAIHVGDSYENDIAPAMALGMMAVLRVHEGTPRADVERAPHCVSSLEELLAMGALTPR